MNTADIAIIAATAAYLATVGAAAAVLFRLAAQLRLSPPPKPSGNGAGSAKSAAEGDR